MTDKLREKTIKRIKKAFEKWYNLLRMDRWKIGISFEDYDEEVPETAARVESDWRYEKAHITFYVEILSRKSDEEIENDVIHEIMHIAVNETQEWRRHEDAWHHEERVATNLARMFQCAVENVKR